MMLIKHSKNLQGQIWKKNPGLEDNIAIFSDKKNNKYFRSMWKYFQNFLAFLKIAFQ